MIVLDTNVLSELMRPVPDPTVLAWVNAQPAGQLWTTAITIFEVRHGLAGLPTGKRRQGLTDAFDLMLSRDLGRRIIHFDTVAATEAASLMARLGAAGRPIEVRDVLIAGTVSAHRATLATRNTRHFADAGIPLIDPWTAVP